MEMRSSRVGNHKVSAAVGGVFVGVGPIRSVEVGGVVVVVHVAAVIMRRVCALHRVRIRIVAGGSGYFVVQLAIVVLETLSNVDRELVFCGDDRLRVRGVGNVHERTFRVHCTVMSHGRRFGVRGLGTRLSEHINGRLGYLEGDDTNLVRCTL